MFKTIIVDDEPVITDEMAELLSSFKDYEVCGGYSDPLKALEDAKHIVPDCAFLDIEMMGMNGIELAEKLLTLNQDMEIIFVTAYNHYAAQAFEVNAVDYLLKPVSQNRLDKSLDRIAKRRLLNQDVINLTCEIKYFGGFEVFVGGQLIKWSRAKTRELFAYMIQCQGKSLSKYMLCEQFWPDCSQEKALAFLQTSIWTIRKKFKALGYEGIRIEYSDHRYFLKLDGVTCDLMAFKKHYQEFKRTADEEVRKKTLNCCQGEYLEGEDWLWAYPDREKYHNMRKELCRR